MRIMRLQQQVGTSLTFVDPLNFASTLRLTLSIAKKASSGKTVLNNSRSEIKTSRDVKVIIPGCADDCKIDTEKVVITTSVSGSVENKVAIKAALKDHLYNLNIAYPDLIAGLLPLFSTEFSVDIETIP